MATYHDTGIIGRPGNECDLVAGTLAGSEVVLEVVDGVAGTLADGTLVASWLAVKETCGT